MTSLCQPLVFWNAQPPPLLISCVFINRSRTRVVTGDASGHLVFWSLQDSQDERSAMESLAAQSLSLSFSANTSSANTSFSIPSQSESFRRARGALRRFACCRPTSLVVSCGSGIID
eukprot:RCo037556